MPTPPNSQRLEQLAHEAAAYWGVNLGRPFVLSQYSYVAPAGSDAVLKVRDLEDDESDEEADALALWDGSGAVRLIRATEGSRVLLLERARPGTDISGLPVDEATAIAVEVGRRLWVPAGEPFRWIGDHVPRWLDEAERSNESPPDLRSLARRLYSSIEPGRSTLIHGDFHHHNILDAGGRHVAIDPKPMLGEPEFDIPPFLWNPLGHQMTLAGTKRRLAVFADAGLDEERMRIWTAIRGAYLGADESESEVIQALL